VCVLPHSDAVNALRGGIVVGVVVIRHHVTPADAIKA
jgi:hypothetical protein